MSEYLLNTYAKNSTNFVKGNNARLYDDKNNEYIDFGAGIAVVSVGHANKRVLDAINDQASKIIHISNLFGIELQERLAQKMVELSGYDMKVFFGNSGAEANEGAIKIARRYGELNKNKSTKTNRTKIITLKNSFHGRTLATLKATGQSNMHKSFGPFPDGFEYAENISDVYNHIDSNTVAVMFELILGEGGVSAWDKEEVQKLATHLKSQDILLIIDEVQTGVYRTGEFLCSNLYGITPDVISLAKGLAGGVPIGAVMTTLKDIFVPGDHGSTFGGNYLSSRAALEVLSILEEAQEEMENNMQYFEKELLIIASKYNLSLTGIGYMRGMKLKDDDTLKAVAEQCLSNKLVVLKSGNSTLRFLPPLTITKEEIDIGISRLKDSLKSVLIK
ncbi:MAG: Acetylornithine aminotransferase (EC [uncultured Campylobacterales bacterium]|uniref:Acetylornithine aminotransferase (EC) n=1 Tax=uncultured Campylobacterales bacterium TaxID=352960 RepID=A0A6S6SYM8_9BACT|nr:MAG: Acetylornithine aminotransferase (EC [uncultured Campylobacterales bacterium]